MVKTSKVKLGVNNYHDWGCRVICKCGAPSYFNKTHFNENDLWTCTHCDRPLIVCNEGIPFYVGLAVFPKEQKWGS